MFSMEVELYGIIVRGDVPLEDLVSLMKLGESKGYDRVDATLGAILRATFVLTNQAKGNQWRSAIEKSQREYMQETLQTIIRRVDFFLGYGTEGEQYLDAGPSSKALLRFLTSRDMEHFDPEALPRDVEEFGRCVRMFELFPEHKEIFLGTPLPARSWEKLRDNWERLEGLYRGPNPGAVSLELRKLYK